MGEEIPAELFDEDFPATVADCVSNAEDS